MKKRGFFSLVVLVYLVISAQYNLFAKSIHPSGISGNSAQQVRDARQLSLFIFDIDGTLTLNVGHYRLRRVAELRSALFQDISKLPKEVLVPVNDFEGNTGPQIAKRIGVRDEHGNFIASTSQDPIELSNGEKIVPAFYYLDPEFSYEEFRTSGDPKKGYFVKEVKKKISENTPFLLEAAPFFAVASDEQYRDQIQGMFLTDRGHHSQELGFAAQSMRHLLGVKKAADWPDSSYAALAHPDFSEFNGQKTNFLKKLYHSLTRRVMKTKSTPHFLVMFENKREHLTNIGKLFMGLSQKGIFNEPVVPILVNFVEPEVFENPDGIDWDRAPMVEFQKMSRVTIYWPDRIERTNDLARVLTLTLGINQKEANRLLTKFNTEMLCRNALIAQNIKSKTVKRSME